MVSLAQYRFSKRFNTEKHQNQERAERIHEKLNELQRLMHEDERFRELGFTLETVDNYVVRHLT